MDFDISPSVVISNHISVQTAADFSGYSLKYIRRLLWCGKLSGLKIGQLWLIDKQDFDSFLQKVKETVDQ